MHKFLLCLFLAIALCGCTVGQNYKKPTIETPQAWRVNEAQSQDAANTQWWKQFNDPVLDELIQIALKENKNLLVATSRIDEYLARYQTTRADLFPQVSAQATGGRARSTQKGPVPLSSAINPTSNDYAAGLNLSWEIDIWGQLRRSTEAARADLLSIQEAKNAVVLTLVANVSSSYIHLLSLDRQLEISRATLKTREDSVTLFQSRFDGGLVSEVELLQVKSEYYATLALIPTIETNIAQQENALNILLGRDPGPVTRGKTFEELKLPVIPAGIPSKVLEQRPDVSQAEQQLIAANARLGAAQAQFFPSISLTSGIGSSSAELKNLFTGPAQTWNFAGSIIGPIFNAGKIRGQVNVAKAQRQQALFNYFIAIQNSFSEVNDALIAQNKIQDQLHSQAQQVEALEKYNSLAWLRYDNGYTDYLEVLDAQRNLFSTQLSYTQTKENLLREMVNLYLAMGGGWGLK